MNKCEDCEEMVEEELEECEGCSEMLCRECTDEHQRDIEADGDCTT